MTRAHGGAPDSGQLGSGQGPLRRLLARLRDVMAGSGSAQSRLDKIVRLIAAEMVAEVCSCYVMRPGEVIELFATVGLNPRAVRRTRLRVSEGVVGEVAATAQPLAIANAPGHPSFAYRPETGEDPFHAFLGVPILRGGKVRGVLVVQNRRRRNYTEEEVEMLQTIAMVVAELVAGGEMVDRSEPAAPSESGILPVRIEGVALNGGLAAGLAVLHRPQVTIREMVADNPLVERRRFRVALDALHSSLDALLANSGAGGREPGEILETYRMLAEDRGWHDRVHEAINAGLTADAAVQRVQNDMGARMSRLTDPYIRERLLDFDDLSNRVVLLLSGKTSVAASGTLPDEAVVVARAIGPAELLDYGQQRLRALILEDGSATSHVAIVAKALDIPVVGHCAEAMTLVEPFDPVIVDGDNNQVFVRPAEDVQEAFQENMRLRVRRRRAYAELVPLPAATLDGVAVSININAGLLADLPHLRDTGADGIGLYRTEIPFMVRADFPDVTAQTELYRKVLNQANGRPVVFRTLDIGGDKLLPYFQTLEQANPALGWRAIRIGLDRPVILRRQLRALLRAAAGRAINIVFPMISAADEFAACRQLLALECERASAEGLALPEHVGVGLMVEVPAVLWQLSAILPQADFVAVGSNDLAQYLFAADRDNPQVSNRYDTLSPPMLNVLADILERCAAYDVPVGLCGEMAGRPLEAMALVGLGFRNLSMAPGAVGPVKTMIRSLNLALLTDYVTALRTGGMGSVRSHLRDFARDHRIPI